MGTIKLTSYGSSLREPVNINGFVLTSVYYSADEIYLLDVISDLTYSDIYFEETDCQGNVYPDGGGRARVKDDSDSEYTAYSMLFYTNYEGEKKIVAVLTSDQNDYVISKNSDAINKFINLDLSAFQYGVSFSSYVSGSRIATQNSDGLLHINDPNTSIDDSYSVYSKSQVDGLVSNFVESSDIPTNVSAFQNDAGYISQIKTINNQSLIGTGNITITSGGGDYATYIGNSAENYVAYSNNVASTGKALLPYADASDSTGYVDLGNSANRWRDAYIKDTIHLYDNSAYIKGSTNLLRLHARNGSNSATSVTTDITSIRFNVYSYTGSSAADYTTHNLIDAKSYGISLYDNHVNIASTETTFNKNVDLVLAKDTNTYIYSGNILSGNDYRYWWANYDQASMSYTSISISMTGETSADSTLEVPINELSSVIPFGKLIVDNSNPSPSIGTTSVTDSLKDLIESGSISSSEAIILCFDSSTPTNIIGVVICAVFNQGETTSENLMFFIPSDDLEIVNYESNPGQGTYFIINNSGSYSLNNDYNFYYRVISKKSIKDYLDNKIESRINQGVTDAEYATYASQVGVYGANNDTDYPLIFTSSVTSSIYGLIYKNVYTDTSNDLYYNPSTNTLTCSTFSGDLSGTATKATQDGNGNIITSYYCTLSTEQTITGNKTFNSNVYIPTSASSNLYVTGYDDGDGIRFGDSTDAVSYPMIVGETRSNTRCDLRQNYYVNNTLAGTIQTQCDSDGNLITTSGLGRSSSTTGKWSLGTSDYHLSSVYADYFYGDLSGNAATATTATTADTAINAISADTATEATTATYSRYIKYGTNTNYPMYASSSTVLRPTLDSSVDIGTSSYRYKNVYADFINGCPIIPFGTCDNAASEDKVVTLSPVPSSLTTGMIICVQFSSTNTKSSPTLNVNALGAKLMYRTSSSAVGTNIATSWPAGSRVLFRYSGSSWSMLSKVDYQTSTASNTNIIPSTNNSYDIGSTDYKWQNLYITGGHSSRYIVIDNSGGEPTIRPDIDNYGYLGSSNYHWYKLYTNNLHVGSNAVQLPPISAAQNTSLGSIQFLRVAIPANTTTGIRNAGTALSSSSYTLMLVTASTGATYLSFRNNTAPSGTWTTLTDMYYYNSTSSVVYTYVLAYKSA